jgi:hypothetical protein
MGGKVGNKLILEEKRRQTIERCIAGYYGIMNLRGRGKKDKKSMLW